MSSLRDRIELLENDLKAVPPRISVYHDMPFAILRYDPAEEWDLRREVKLLATRLEATDKEVHSIPMSEFLWTAIDKTEGLDEVVGLERSRGYLAAQDQVTTYLSETERIAELMYTVLLRELDYAEDFDIAELEIELEAEGKLDQFITACKKLHKLDWRMVRKGAQKLSRASAVLHDLDHALGAHVDARVALLLQHLQDFGFAEVLRHRDRESDH